MPAGTEAAVLRASPANGDAESTISRCSVSGSRSHTRRHPSSPAVASQLMFLQWPDSKARSRTLKLFSEALFALESCSTSTPARRRTSRRPRARSATAVGVRRRVRGARDGAVRRPLRPTESITQAVRQHTFAGAAALARRVSPLVAPLAAIPTPVLAERSRGRPGCRPESSGTSSRCRRFDCNFGGACLGPQWLGRGRGRPSIVAGHRELPARDSGHDLYPPMAPQDPRPMIWAFIGPGAVGRSNSAARSSFPGCATTRPIPTPS